MSILHLLYEVANEFSEVNLDDIHAELSRRMTPPPGCVRIGDKDVKVLGEFAMTKDGFIVAEYSGRLCDEHGVEVSLMTSKQWYVKQFYSSKEAAEAARSSKA